MAVERLENTSRPPAEETLEGAEAGPLVGAAQVPPPIAAAGTEEVATMATGMEEEVAVMAAGMEAGGITTAAGAAAAEDSTVAMVAVTAVALLLLTVVGPKGRDGSLRCSHLLVRINK